MPKHKLKKTKPNPSAPKFQFKEIDLKILQSLADYRFLNTKQLAILHQINLRTLRGRLKRLFHAGYIIRPKYQFHYFAPTPTKHIIHALGKQGAKFVFADQRVNLNWTSKNRNISSLYLWHALMVSDFRFILTLALRNAAGVKITNWQQENLLEYVSYQGERLCLKPDAFFTLEDKNNYMHFFLEADRSKMGHKKFFKKMKAYWEWWKLGRPKKKFGIERFRVLTIVISDQRKGNLRLTTKAVDDKRQGSEMFLFANHNDYSLDNPESILEPIWQSPKDDKQHHLLE